MPGGCQLRRGRHVTPALMALWSAIPSVAMARGSQQEAWVVAVLRLPTYATRKRLAQALYSECAAGVQYYGPSVETYKLASCTNTFK